MMTQTKHLALAALLALTVAGFSAGGSSFARLSSDCTQTGVAHSSPASSSVEGGGGSHARQAGKAKENPADLMREGTQEVSAGEKLSRQATMNLRPGFERLYQNTRTREEIMAHRAKHTPKREYPVTSVGANGTPVMDGGLELVNTIIDDG